MRLVHDNGAVVTADGVDLTLVKLIHKARAWWQCMATGKLDVTGLAQQESASTTYVVRVLRLPFLSLAVVEAVPDGRLRAVIDENALFDARAIRPEWDRQAKSIVLAGEPQAGPIAGLNVVPCSNTSWQENPAVS